MEYLAKKDGRIVNSKFLKIIPSILRVGGVMVSKDVSNKADAVFRKVDDIVEEMDLEVMYTRMDWKDSSVKERLKAAKKCEILIPDVVPVEYISNI